MKKVDYISFFKFVSIFGFLFVYNISKMIDNAFSDNIFRKLFIFLGDNTLIIFLSQKSIMIILEKMFSMLSINNMIFKILFMVILVLFINVPIIWIVNKYFPFLNGKIAPIDRRKSSILSK